MTDAKATEEPQKPTEQAEAIPSGESSTTEAPTVAAPVQSETGQEQAEKSAELAPEVHAEIERTRSPLSRASPSRTSRSSSRAAERGRHSNPPERVDSERSPSSTPSARPQPHVPSRPPRHAEARLPMRPDLMDNRRDKQHDFPRGGRYNDHDSRSFDQSTNETRNYGRLDRELPARPPADEQLRAPSYREGRGRRDPSWPERPGRLRASESFQGRAEQERASREGQTGPRSGPSTHPDRVDLIQDQQDRAGDGRRGDMPRPDKDDRRSLQSTLPMPRADLPNRPERFPGEDRRSANFTQPSPRRDDLPTGPRSERAPRAPMDPPSVRDTMPGPDMNHGRLRQPESSDIPLGPRGRSTGRGGRSFSGAQHPSQSPFSSPSGAMDRQPPTGPGRQGMRNSFDQPPPTLPSPPASEPLDTSGIHPDRLKVMQQREPNQGGYRRSHQPPGSSLVPPSGPRGAQTPSTGPSPMTRGPPSGAFGGERGRGDKRFAGINNMLQQSLGPADRGPGTTIRGRGASRAMNAPSAQVPPAGVVDDGSHSVPSTPGRPDLMAGRSGSHADTQGVGRSRGGRADLMDEPAPEARRSLRHSTSSNFPDRERERERERDRRGDDEGGRSGSRREEYRERTGTRDFERERSRRSEGSANVNREERHDSREALRRGGGAREENRRRERREREDGPDAAQNSHEHEGRLRPPSSLGVVPPPPPPPPFAPGSQDDRRWSGGHDGRDRDRDRTRMRDRDYNRKRGRPGGDETGGIRQGGENKRPRRGV